MTLWILSSSVLILVIAGLRTLLKGKIAPWLQYTLWLLVLARLLVPGTLTESRISVANLLPQDEAVAAAPSVPVAAAQPVQSYTPPIAATPAPTISDVPVTALPETVSTAQPFDWNNLLRGIWIAGVLLVLLALLWGNLSFYLRLKRSRKNLGLELPLPVYAAEGLPSPCLFGLLRPAVYIPASYTENQQTMAHILAHEWAHCKHGDHLWSLLRGLCVALHWYNPLVWLAAVLSKQDAELACDASAIRQLGEAQRASYGKTLLGLITARPRPADLLSCATTMRSGKRSLRQRITYIARKPKMLAITAVCVVLTAAVAVGCTFTGASAPAGDMEAIEADSAVLSLSYLDTEVQLSGKETAQLLALYNSQQITETSRPMDVPSRLTVQFQQDGRETAVWYVSRDGICAGEGLGNYVWENADYETVSDLFWNGLSVDGGYISNPLSSIASPALTTAQVQEVLRLYRSMVLTPTANEPDWADRYEVRLVDSQRLVLSFWIDSKGEVMFIDSDQNYYYMCEDGASFYQQFRTVKGEVTRQMPDWTQTVLDYIASQAKAIQENYGYTVLDTSLNGLIPLTQSSSAEYQASLLKYKIRIENPESVVLADGMELTDDGWLTERCSLGQPVLMFRLQKDQLSYLGANYTDIVEAEFNGDYEQAARSMAVQAELQAFLSGTAYDAQTHTLTFPLTAEDSPVQQFSISGRMEPEAGNGMSYHRDIQPGESVTLDLSVFTEAYLSASMAWTDSDGSHTLTHDEDLLNALGLAPAGAANGAELKPALQALFDTGGLQMSMVVEGDMYYDGALITDSWYVDRFSSIFSDYSWSPVNADTGALQAESDYYITLSAKDGSGRFRFYAGGELVEYSQGSGASICYRVTGSTMSITEAILVEYSLLEANYQKAILADSSLSGSETLNDVAEGWVRAWGQQLLNLSPYNVSRLKAFEVVDCQIDAIPKDGSRSRLGIQFTVAIQDYAEAPEASYWMAGNTEIGTGQWEGWLIFSRFGILEHQEDGWQCIELGTGIPFSEDEWSVADEAICGLPLAP